MNGGTNGPMEEDATKEKNVRWKFNSLVCFDLETTGLPEFGTVKITELALVGVVRSHIQAKNTSSLPRVSHKLSFTVYPQKAISLPASEVSGLWNDLLEPIKPWDANTFKMLLAFLDLLPPPVCLVAHNGYKFDFPVLKQHLQQIKQSLPGHIIYVDSLPAFQKLLGDVEKSSSLIEEMTEDMASGNNAIIRAAEEAEAQLGGVFATKKPEVTPDSKILSNSIIFAKQRRTESSADKVPNPSKLRVRKCLFPTKQPVSYKLCDIYSHLFNHPPEASHNAEGDAVTLLKCILKVAPDFLKYANENHETFSSLPHLK